MNDILKAPVARASVLWSLKAFSELDIEPQADRAIIYDNSTAMVDWVLDEGDLNRLIGDILYNQAEVRALEGVRAASNLLYRSLGGKATDEQIVTHPDLSALICAASYAVLVMKAASAENKPGDQQLETDEP